MAAGPISARQRVWNTAWTLSRTVSCTLVGAGLAGPTADPGGKTLSQLDRRKALRIFAALGTGGLLTPSLSSCVGAQRDREPELALGDAVRIGFVVPHSGANRAVGDEISNGFQLYSRATGDRLGGRRVELVNSDEGETPESALAAVDRLIKDGVAAIVGISTPVALQAIKPAIEKAKTPLVTPSPCFAALNDAGYIWRTSFITQEPGVAICSWIVEHASRVVVLAEDTPAAHDDVRVFVDAFTAAGGVLAGEPRFTPSGTTDFSEQLAYIAEEQAGAVYCMYSGAAGVGFVRQLKGADLPATLQVYGPGPLTEGAQLGQQGSAANGIYTAMNYSADLNTAVNRRFVAEYQKRYASNPTACAVAAYDAAAVLDRAFLAMERVSNGTALNNAIGRLGQIDSPRGTWQFNQRRSPLQKWFLRRVTDDGPVLANLVTSELVTLG